ncbi:MAG TPA: acylphosphatase [Casimicrobiaceae bacterium]|nr:acylphosphatase [Casimicrobiaceae bacterium]
MIARRLTIRGRVQGVGFRFALADEARERGLTGWVRNRRDGTVEALVTGPQPDVEALIAWARRGPPAARVSEVSVEAAAATAERFEIAPTA